MTLLIETMEQKFKEISGIQCDLKKFPLTKSDIKDNTPINKEKSNQFGEVFTPLWLIDKMILKAGVDKLINSPSTLDLCAGWGQFTIRMIRAICNHKKYFHVKKWLRDNHTFIEIQVSSAYKIMTIFGTDINLLIGDAVKLKEVTNWNGVGYFDNYWKSIPKNWIDNQIKNDEETFVRNFIQKFKEREKTILKV